jgi:hypothetical protein
MNAHVNVNNATAVVVKTLATKSNKRAINQDFLDEFGASARDEGKFFQATVNLLKSANVQWDNDEQVKSIARTYRLHRMVGTLSAMNNAKGEAKYPVVSVADVEAWTDMDKADKEKFMKGDYFNAYRSALSSFTLVAKRAGKPQKASVKRGAATTPEANVDKGLMAEGATLPDNLPLEVVRMVAIKSETDAMALGVNVAKIIQTSLNETPEGVKIGIWYSLFQDFLAEVKDAASRANK